MKPRSLSERVAITGMGMICSLGKDAETVGNAMSRGVSGVSPLTLFRDSGIEDVFGYEATTILPQNSMPRCAQLLLSACEEAWNSAGRPESSEKVGVIIGSGLSNSYLLENQEKPFVDQYLQNNDLATIVKNAIAIQGPSLVIAGACAAGNYAIAHAFDMIRAGECDVVLAAGCDTITSSMYGGIARVNSHVSKQCAPFSLDRKGMLMGEGAGALVLERMDRAIARGRQPLAELLGCGHSCDASHPTAMTLEGIVAAMTRALGDADVAPETIDYVCAHGTGTKLNDVMETAGLKEVLGAHARKIPISSLKSMIGHTSGASGSIGAVSTIRMMQLKKVFPTINYTAQDPECDLDYVPNQSRHHQIHTAMVNAFGFGGYNCCLVLRSSEVFH